MINQVILIGHVRSIKKVKGTIVSFHLDIPRQSNKEIIDSPIIKLQPEFTLPTSGITEGALVAVKACINTVVAGGYGTVTYIVAQRLTYLSSN
jgi:hypothetical protein